MARVYRDGAGNLDWQMTMAREWAEEVRGWYGAQGGWIYGRKQPRQNEQPICQGWKTLYTRYSVDILNWFTRTWTAFDSFDAMLSAQGGYRPTLIGGGRNGWRFEALASAYDLSQQRRGDSRRAYRG